MSKVPAASGFRAGVQSFVESLASPKILFSNLTAAAVVAILNATGAVSVAALVFSGPLTPYLAMGMGMFLVGNVISALMVPTLSAYKANMASIRTGQAPIFAAMAISVTFAMQGSAAENMAVTTVATILVATIAIGALMYGLGLAKLGTLARYIPYPVMGGFFAGLGYLTATGGMVVALGPIASLSDPAGLLKPDALFHLFPAFAFALLLLALGKVIRHWLLMPVYLIAFMAAFYAVLAATGGDVGSATIDHWLPSLAGDDLGFFPVIVPAQIGLVDWMVVAQQSATIAVLALLSVTMLLLDVSGVEIVINRDLDPNRELKAAGIANMVTGLGTGSLSFQSLADTAFSHKLGGDRYLMIVVYVALSIGVIALGPAPIAYVPSFILGGLLLYVGIAMLLEWVWDARRKLPLADYLVVLCILFVIARYGILEGVVAGLTLATVLFVHKYSRLNIIRTRMSGAEFVSNIDRHRDEQAWIDQRGTELQIFVLQGFLFFGSASRLLEQIGTVINAPERSALRYLVLDFQHVDAMDTSAVNSFAKLVQVCNRETITLVLSHCSDEIAERLKGVTKDMSVPAGGLHFFDDLDEGVGWCNDTMLEHFTPPGDSGAHTPLALLTNLLGDADAARVLETVFAKVQAPAGEMLFSQGDPGDALFLIVSGAISIRLDLAGGKSMTVRSMQAGSIVGEMALYTGAPRTASALVKKDSVLLRLDREFFEQCRTQYPREFGLFHSYIIRLMAERLGRANREIAALRR